MDTPIIITIDGPSGVGKSTIAKRLAKKLGIAYLDTGAMYRKLSLLLGEKAQNFSSEQLLTQCKKYTFQLHGTGENTYLTCNNQPINDEVRTENAGKLASVLSALTPIRSYMKSIQRDIGSRISLISEGRDMGTEVFPDAPFKFFLEAKIQARAQRRFEQLTQQGIPTTLAEITQSIEYRDSRDKTRTLSPLFPAADAVIIETSNMDTNSVLKTILAHIKGQ